MCTLRTADRDLSRLESELDFATQRLLGVDEELLQEKETVERLQKEIHRNRKQLVRDELPVIFFYA